MIVDLSANNAEPDWRALKRAGIEGVWLKATEGRTYDDPDFAGWRAAANRVGLRVGAYHFARPDRNPFEAAEEAEHFRRKVGWIGRRDLRPVLDYEVRSSHGNDEEWVRVFNAHILSLLGVGPVFYSYPALIEQLRFSKPRGYGLWLASYGRNDGKPHEYRVPAPWRKAVAHQFSSRCRVAGCDGYVDLSRVFQPRAVLAHPLKGRV